MSKATAPARPSAMSAEELLAALAQLRAQAALLESDYEQKRKEIMKAVLEPLMELDAEYAQPREAVQAQLAALDATVRAAVIARGETVSADGVQAVYVRGTVKWDDRALQGYSAVHPEVMKFQKVGEPHVQIRNAS